MALNIKEAQEEFALLKEQERERNYEYYLLRQAVKGNFRWPVDWPKHVPKQKRNLCKPITERFATYLMGQGFDFNIERPNTLNYRETAERTEKILEVLFELSNAPLQWAMGAKTGSELGRTIFKVYKKGATGAEHACFTYCQPDYFYGIPTGDDQLSDYSVVYYSYPLDVAAAKRQYGPRDYKTERQLAGGQRYEDRRNNVNPYGQLSDRRIPVLECWTKDDYALVVGGVTIYNDKNPNKWIKTGEGFIPFVVIENSRNSGEARGEADIAQSRELNETYNQLFSLKHHIVKRWLRPTLVWEGAPSNYAEILAQTINGGGAIPARLGSKLYFLTHDRENTAVMELESETRAAILENAGMTDTALQGTVQGSINTGPSAAMQFQPVVASVEAKQTEWTWGLKRKCAMMLNIQEQIGNSAALGEAVINNTMASENNGDGEVVALSGYDIAGLREVVINWPGVLPKDDVALANLEIQKAQAGMQSYYTTLEKLGEKYPDDELSRVRMENQDPSLRGEKVAEQLRAQTPLLKAGADAQLKQEQMAMQQQQANQQNELAMMQAEAQAAPNDDELAKQGDIGARLRQMQKAHQARLDMEGEGAPSIAIGG